MGGRRQGRGQTALLEQGLAAVSQAVHELSQHMAQLAVNSVQIGVAAPPAPSPELPICDPEPFAGDLSQCRGFLFQCRTFLTPSASDGTVPGELRGPTVEGPRAKLGSDSACQWDPGQAHGGEVPAARRAGIQPAGLRQQCCR